MKGMAMEKYSLWFMPTGAVENKFSALIAQLADQYSLPKFPPHITVLGSIEAREEEMIKKTQHLAERLSPCVIRLADVSYTDYYYRALFIRVEESSSLLRAFREAVKTFPGVTQYMPHLSLLYGDLSVEIKKQIIKKIGDKFTDEFEADMLHLYRTAGDVNSWSKVNEFSLGR